MGASKILRLAIVVQIPHLIMRLGYAVSNGHALDALLFYRF
jgi:hypothetical protein